MYSFSFHIHESVHVSYVTEHTEHDQTSCLTVQGPGEITTANYPNNYYNNEHWCIMIVGSVSDV